jgi:hypothetical protein
MLHDLKKISDSNKKHLIKSKIRSLNNRLVEGRTAKTRTSISDTIERIDNAEDRLDDMIEKLGPIEKKYSKFLEKIDDLFDPIYDELSELGVLDRNSEFASSQLIALKEKEHKAIMTLQRVVVKIEEELDDHARRLRRIKGVYKKQLRRL